MRANFRGISLELLKEQLLNCERLLAYYRGENDNYMGFCPFCRANSLFTKPTLCENCPWFWFTLRNCFFTSRLIPELRRCRSPGFLQHRIPQLKSWIVRLQSAIKYRERKQLRKQLNEI